jgi:hypothetical protein
VSLADVRRSFRGRRLPPNAVLVTFDDGYADIEAAVPILRRAGVPATFFIVTAFPDGGRLFWWDRIWLLLRRCRRERVELTYPAPLVIHPTRALGAAAHALIAAVKLTPRLHLERFWEGLERASGVALAAAEERALAAHTLLGWSAVRRLRGAGMDVQSHSHEHLVLNGLSPEIWRARRAGSATPSASPPSAWPTRSATRSPAPTAPRRPPPASSSASPTARGSARRTAPIPSTSPASPWTSASASPAARPDSSSATASPAAHGPPPPATPRASAKHPSPHPPRRATRSSGVTRRADGDMRNPTW